MAETPQYLSEFVCAKCGRTGHVTWEGTGDSKRVVEKTETLEHLPGGGAGISCAHCGTSLQAI